MPRAACSSMWQWNAQPPDVVAVGVLPDAVIRPSRPVSSILTAKRTMFRLRPFAPRRLGT